MSIASQRRRSRVVRLAVALLWLTSLCFGAIAATPSSAATPLVVSGITPATGSTAGGTSVTITGTGFVTGAKVMIGAATATEVVVGPTGTNITAITPAGTAGAANVAVTNPDQSVNILAGGFTYGAAGLSVTAISPSSGPTAGGTSVTIAGTGFVTGATVTIGGVACTAPAVASATAISCVTPPGAAGATNVVVTNPGQPASTLASGYIYTTPVPALPLTVSGISPISGPTSGGTNIAINGTGFITGTTVTIAGLACTNTTVFNSGRIICATPVIAVGVGGAADVVVTAPNGQSTTVAGGFNYVTPPDPTITAITPSVGPVAGGIEVVISGAGFVTGATVTIGASACANVAVFNSGKTVSCTTAAGTAGTANVVVTNPNGTVISRPGGFKYSATAAPTVTAIAPASGPTSGGTSVTITGTGFASGATVTIGGTAASGVTVASTGVSITAITPAGAAGAVNVVVTNTDMQSATLTGGFTYGAAGLSVTAISPSSGPTAGGTSVTIAGTGFVTGATVTIGGVACTAPAVASATAISCVTPPGAAGATNVVVTNPGQPASTLTGGFTYVAPAAAVLTPPPTINAAFAPVAPSADGADHRYFPETHHSLKAGFKLFWDAQGGVAIFGLPISEEFQEQSKTDGKTYTVQYFERNRFEYHPEFKGTPYEVELGLLGVQMTAGRSGDAPFKPVAPFTSTPKKLFVAATGHSLSGGFRAMWEAPNGLTLLGYPISESFEEKNSDDGKTYTVQYFERARLELHREFAGTPNEDLLGLLGIQAAIQRGYLPAP